MKAAEAYFGGRGYVLGALWAALLLGRVHSFAPLRPLALVPVAAGFFLRLWASRYIGAHSNGMVMAPGRGLSDEATAAGGMATGGPYALMRHPLYLSNLLVASGAIYFANSGRTRGRLALLTAVSSHHLLLVRVEERYLWKTLGEIYARYREVTPLLPGIGGGSGFSQAGPAPFSWREAFARQGGNLARACAAIAILAAARWRR